MAMADLPRSPPPRRPSLPNTATYLSTSPTRSLPRPLAFARPAPPPWHHPVPSSSRQDTSHGQPAQSIQHGRTSSSSPGTEPADPQRSPSSLDTLSAAAAHASRIEAPLSFPSSASPAGVTTVGSLVDGVAATPPSPSRTGPVPSTSTSAAAATGGANGGDVVPAKRSISPGASHKAGSPDDDVKTKRQRSLRACDACRSKKIRCLPLGGELETPGSTPPSGPPSQPCGNCVRTGSECTFSRVPLKRGPNKGFIQALEDRIRTLESSIQNDDGPTPSTSAVAAAPDVPSVSFSKKKIRSLPQRASDLERFVAVVNHPSKPHPTTTSYRDVIEAVYASTWQSSFRILPDRYRHDGFKHPVLHDAARFLIDVPPTSSSYDDHHHDAGGRAASVDAYWASLADAVGAATVGMSMRKVRTVENVVKEEKELALRRRRTSRDRAGTVKPSTMTGGAAPGAEAREAQGEEEGDPHRRLEQEVAEDEFSATVMLYCAAAKGGRLVGALLAAAWAKLGALEGVRRERAEWVHFQLDVWHSLGTHEPTSCRFLPLRRDLPRGRALLSIQDDSAAAGLLLSTAMLGGLAARAAEAAGWTEIREHEVSLTFGWRWSDDQDSDSRRRYKSRPAGADPPMATVYDQREGEGDGAKARDHVQNAFGLFAKLYHRMHGLPRMDAATLTTVEEVLFDAAKLVESAGQPDRLVGCEVASAHVLGLATSALAWCASTAFNLPRDPTAVSLMTESTDHLSALAQTARACAAKRTSPTPACLARVGQVAEEFAKAPRDLPDVIKGTVLELGCLGSF